MFCCVFFCVLLLLLCFLCFCYVSQQLQKNCFTCNWKLPFRLLIFSGLCIYLKTQNRRTFDHSDLYIWLVVPALWLCWDSECVNLTIYDPSIVTNIVRWSGNDKFGAPSLFSFSPPTTSTIHPVVDTRAQPEGNQQFILYTSLYWWACCYLSYFHSAPMLAIQ